jgi:hypothetical protein
VWSLALLVPWPAGGDGDSATAAMLVFTATLVYLIVVLTSVGHMIGRPAEPDGSGPAGRVRSG